LISEQLVAKIADALVLLWRHDGYVGEQILAGIPPMEGLFAGVDSRLGPHE